MSSIEHSTVTKTRVERMMTSTKNSEKSAVYQCSAASMPLLLPPHFFFVIKTMLPINVALILVDSEVFTELIIWKLQHRKSHLDLQMTFRIH